MDWIAADTTVVDLSTGLLTPVIAIFGGYIAWQQWQVNRASLKEKLFESRFLIFKETQRFLSEILATTKFTGESYTKFIDACQRARFYFGKDFQNYLLEIRSRASKMRRYCEQAKEHEVGETKSKLIEREFAEMEWLNNQLNVIFDKFEPFIGFEKHK